MADTHDRAAQDAKREEQEKAREESAQAAPSGEGLSLADNQAKQGGQGGDVAAAPGEETPASAAGEANAADDAPGGQDPEPQASSGEESGGASAAPESPAEAGDHTAAGSTTTANQYTLVDLSQEPVLLKEKKDVTLDQFMDLDSDEPEATDEKDKD